MKEQIYSYVYHPGHLGHRPVTELTAQRGILWDAPVKRVPAAFVSSLVTDGGFHLALDHDEATTILEIPKKKLAELVDAGRLETNVYRPSREGEPDVPVVVLPRGLNPAALKAQLN